MTLWLGDKPLVLASQSAARRRVLEGAAIPFEIRPAGIDERAVETQAGKMEPGEAAILLARSKAQVVSASMPERLVLGADQTLSLGGQRFSKPKDTADARSQLRALSGKTHELHSAIALIQGGRAVFEHAGVARLTMRTLTPGFIERYAETAGDAVMHSVGGYQIEGAGAHLFETVDGDHFTILGLPLFALLDYLRRENWIAA